MIENCQKILLLNWKGWNEKIVMRNDGWELSWSNNHIKHINCDTMP